MENLNNVPSTGTFGGSISTINSNFDLVVNAINSLEYQTTRSKGILNYGQNPATVFPNAVAGDWCMILSQGNVFPATIKTFNGSTWSGSGTWNPDGVDLTQYAQKSEMTTAIANSLVQATARMGYGECTVSGTSLAVSIPNFILPTSGGTVHIKMSAVGTGASTLNINSTGAKTLWYNGAAVSVQNTWEANEIISVFYDGTRFMASNSQGAASLAKEIEYDEYTISKKIIDIDKELKKKSSKQDVIDNEYVIAKAFNKLGGTNNGGNSSSNKGVLSVANSDIINVIGSSYTFGGFTLAGKNWVHRISELSDYQYNNDGVDGASYESQLSGNYQANSIRFKKYCIGKYVILNDNENRGVPDNKTSTQWFKTLDNIVRVCVGLGVEPILATNWTQGDNFQGVSQMYEDYARERGLIYMNGNYYSKTLSTNYAQFTAGSHLGTRYQGIFSDAYIPYLERMERPYKSMKIFRLRSSYNTVDLNQLMFTTNRERLKIFRELWYGKSSCDQNKVDNYPNASMTTKCPNEYATLRDGGAISFTRAALISAVLPYTGKDITQLEFVADIHGEVQVYVKDVLATPYPSTANYTRFNIPNEISVIPSTGAKYSDGTTEFTVNHVVIGENGSFCTIYMNGWTDGNQEGTLTKTSGSGENTISYNIREYISESATESDTCGHWVKIEKESTKYVFTDIASRIVDMDKLHILIIGDSFTLSQPRIYYAGEQVKFRNRKEYRLLLNADNSNQELIQEPTFGTVGTALNTWKDDSNNNLISEANYEITHPDKWNDTGLPANTSSILKVDDSHAINTTVPSIPSSGNLMLEIYARYFAPIYTDGSGNQITFESYDYEDMYIQMGDATYGSTIKKTVGLMWQIIQIPMVRPGQISSKLRIYGGPKGIEIAKVSLKKVQNYETY